jgi:hypothetical protein
MPDNEQESNKVDVGTISDAKLTTLLEAVLSANKDDIETWRARQEKIFEPNIVKIDPEKFVAILDISLSMIDQWDGTNGYYDLDPKDYIDAMSQYGEQVEGDPYQTKQGLAKIYRFDLKINEVAGDKVLQYRIMRASDAEGVGYFVSGFNPIQSIEMRMRRASVV